MLRFSKRLTKWATVMIVGCLALFGRMAAAETFVSFNGKFHFDYSEDWAQVDYTTAEYYLKRGDAEATVDFEAVFSEKESFVMFQGQYLILTVDTVGPMSPQATDSVVASLSEEFERPVKYVSPVEFLASPVTDSISYDTTNQLVGIETEVPGGDAGPRVNLLVMKLYEYGIANYYFYAPRVEFATSLPVFRDMVVSFSTGEVPNADPADVRVADLDDDDDDGMPVAIYGGLAAVLIAVIASRKRWRAKKQ